MRKLQKKAAKAKPRKKSIVKKTTKPSRPKSRTAQTDELKEKEILIIQMVCDQFTNHQIAKKIKMPVRTVDDYRLRILRKLKVKNTAGMVVYAIKHKIYKIK